MFSLFYVMQSSSSDNTQCIYGIAGVVFGIIWGAVCGNIMKKKGRSQGAGWALGFFLGLIGVLICALLSNKNQTMMYGQMPFGAQLRPDEIRCPHCQNVIKIGAMTCPFCGKDPRIPPTQYPPTQPPTAQ